MPKPIPQFMRGFLPVSGGNTPWLPRTVTALLTAALFAIIALGGRPAPVSAETVPNGHGLLWKIEAPDGDTGPSYLFGTLHVTDERVLDLPAPVREAFAHARAATFEIILSDDVHRMMGRAMVLNDGRTLDQIVPPALYERIVVAGRRYGLSKPQLQHLKPWALAAVFSIPQAELERSVKGILPLDQWLQAEAAREGKVLRALETPEEQIQLFDGMREMDQIDMLAAAVNDNAAIEQLFATMTSSYLARDVASIMEGMRTQTSEAGARFMELFLRRFNSDRNQTMVRRMEPILREGEAFVAVGALHLPGKEGLVSLLQERGYRLTRVY